MKRLLTITILVAGCILCVHAGRAVEPDDGPTLLAKGKGYTIHVFNGAVQGDIYRSRTAGPGIVVFHTNNDTGKATWMIRTGTFEISTVRISYSVSRLLGLFQSDTHIAMVTYYTGRVYDKPPTTPPPDKGGYRLSVFEKVSGKKQFDIELNVSKVRPKQVPEETTELGIIKKSDDGFSVLGTSIAVLSDGKMKEKDSQQKNPPDKK